MVVGLYQGKFNIDPKGVVYGYEIINMSVLKWRTTSRIFCPNQLLKLIILQIITQQIQM